MTGTPTEELTAALRRLLVVTRDRAVGIAREKVESLGQTLDDIAARGDVRTGALAAAAGAAVAGENPLSGAVKGALAALSPGARAALMVALMLAVLLLPVTVLLVLLLAIVVVIVAAVRSGSDGR